MGPLPAATALPPPPSSISDHFLRLLESTEMSDVTFRVGHRDFPAHTAVLAARSPVFGAMFSGGRPPEAQQDGAGRRLVRIDDTAPAAFEALLHFVYADALPPKVSAAAGDMATVFFRAAGRGRQVRRGEDAAAVRARAARRRRRRGHRGGRAGVRGSSPLRRAQGILRRVPRFVARPRGMHNPHKQLSLYST